MTRSLQDPAHGIPRAVRAAPKGRPGPAEGASAGPGGTLSSLPPDPGTVARNASPVPGTRCGSSRAVTGNRAEASQAPVTAVPDESRASGPTAVTGPQSPAGTVTRSSPVRRADGAVPAGSSELERWPQPPASQDIYVRLTLDIEPVSKNRARVSAAEYTQIGGQRVKTKGAHGYSTQRLKKYEEKIGWLLLQAKVKRNDVDDLGVHAVFHVRGNQRRDLDNLVKSLLDGCNEVAWRDDQQVVRLTTDLIRDSEHPRVELIIYVVNSRARNCHRCGKPLTAKQITIDQIHCSKDCYDSDQRKGAYRACVVCGTTVYRSVDKARAKDTYCSPVCRVAGRGTCRQCGAPNDKPQSSRSGFCSTECSVEWHRRRPLSKDMHTHPGVCTDCGRQTSNVGVKRCRGCWIAYRAVNGQPSKRRPSYDTCPDCGGPKRTTASRCASCFRVAIKTGTAGRWAKEAARELAALAGLRGAA